VNHGDAAPLAAGGIIPASILSRGACIIKKKNKQTNKPYNHFFVSRRLCLGDVDGCLLLRFFLGLPRRQLLSDLDQSSGKIYLQPLTNASIYLRFAVVAPSSSSVAHPNSRVVASLRDCIGLHNIFLRGGGLISISFTCPRPTPYFSFISWVLRIPLGISSQLIRFLGSRPRHFHRHLWGLFTTMVPISCVNI